MDAFLEPAVLKFASPDNAGKLTVWLREADLNKDAFHKRLVDWFENFQAEEDKKLALSLLLKFKYYSQSLFEETLSSRLDQLYSEVAQAGIAQDEIIFVVDDDYSDSSASFPYHASKLNQSRNINVSPISRLDTAKDKFKAIVILNDTQGSGNQFIKNIWPAISKQGNIKVYVVCLELAQSAFETLSQLSEKIKLIPPHPTNHSLDWLKKNNYISEVERKRVEQFGRDAHPPLPLGYGECGMLVAYYYQCPNNTLPIFWGKGKPNPGQKWKNIFDYKEKTPRRKGVTEYVTPHRLQPKGHKKHSFDLKSTIQSTSWVTGAVNFDEDLHFSSFYLRASCAAFMPDAQKEFGYSTVIGSYRDFNETYYIPRQECQDVATALLARVVKDPDWLQQILDEIAVRAHALSEVFNHPPRDDIFIDLDRGELLQIYRKHNHAHASLYEVARIPEALDRGFGIFTRHLQSTLREYIQAEGSDTKTINAYFNILTFPEKASLAYEELTDFRRLVRDVRNSDQGIFRGSSKRALLKLNPGLREKLTHHRDKWSYWGYHGYGSRALPDAEEYLQRMASEFAGQDNDLIDSYQQTVEKAEGQRVRLAKRLKLPDELQQLYRLHSRIGLAKLLRRFHQLRNFFFLDRLLIVIAERLGESEAVIRSLLPSELERALEGTLNITPEMRKRVEHCVYLIHNGQEHVISDDAQCLMTDALLRRHVTTGAGDAEILQGQVASPGVARGQCKIVIRRQDAERVGFKDGDILVSESTDPDLRGWIQRSGGVITEAGGATCHAAIICRELGKPAIVGVDGAIQRLHNGDWVVLDADQGIVTLQARLDRRFTVDGKSAYERGVDQLGSKAHTLSRLLRANARVPEFFCLPLSYISNSLQESTSDSDGQVRQEMEAELRAALRLLSGNMFAIRSSMPLEDSAEASYAGHWHSDIGVLRQDVVREIFRYIDQLGRLRAPPETGCLIIQEMVLGERSGVCFTRDPRQEFSDSMLLELVPGGNELLTGGQISPIQYLVSRKTRLATLSSPGATSLTSFVNTEQIQLVARTCLEVEAILGGNQDIEWTQLQDSVFILQSRPNSAGVGGSTRAPTQSESSSSFLTHITAIYRAFRVPPNLQRHLLRVAAVGKTICDHWSGPSIDRNKVLAALLLHDIGNIVKADYDRYPELYSEEIRNLGYWKAVQDWTRNLFGKDDLTASLSIAKEAGAPPHVLELMSKKQFSNNILTSLSTDFEIKIAAYSDQRVGPNGVMPIEERLAEARKRYRGVSYASVNRGDFDALLKAAFEIEQQISEFSGLPLDEIDDELISEEVERLRDIDFSKLVQ